MKPAPAPVVAGNTPWERLDSAVRQVFTVQKKDLLKADEKIKRAKLAKQLKQKP